VKERLTGAIILVALIVLLVPELLTGPIRMRSASATATTAAAIGGGSAAHGESPLRSYTMTLGGAPAPVQQSPSAAPTQTPSTQPALPTPSPQAGPPETSAPSPPPPVPQDSLQGANPPAHQAVQEDRSSASATGWVVQLGSFASRQNAERLARSLERKGFRMSVSPAHGGSRVLWRVRAGPAHDHAGAVHLAARLRALGHRGELLPVR
jgi:DedD protein